jgi:hypothetical protein
MAADTDELRRKFQYRALILRGKIRLRPEVAARLIGPDCAYHLYRTVGSSEHDERQTAERDARTVASDS